MSLINRLIIICIILLFYKSALSIELVKDSTSYYYLYTDINKSKLVISLPSEYKIKDLTSYFFLFNKEKIRDLSYKETYVFSKSKIIKKNYLGSNKIEKDTIVSASPHQYTDITTDEIKFPDWIIGIIFFSVALLAWLSFYYNKYLGKLFNSIIFYKKSANLFEESKVLTGRSAIILMFVFFVNLSLFSLELLEFYKFNFMIFNFSINKSILLVSIFVFSVMLYFANNVLLSIFSYIFEIRTIVSEYKFNQNLYYQLTGIILLIFVIAIPYLDLLFTKTMIYIAYFLLILLYLLKNIRLIKIIFHKQFSLFYLFLYLCTSEIIPFVIIIKIIKNTV